MKRDFRSAFGRWFPLILLFLHLLTCLCDVRILCNILLYITQKMIIEKVYVKKYISVLHNIIYIIKINYRNIIILSHILHYYISINAIYVLLNNFWSDFVDRSSSTVVPLAFTLFRFFYRALENLLLS